MKQLNDTVSFEEQIMSKDKNIGAYIFAPNEGYGVNFSQKVRI